VRPALFNVIRARVPEADLLIDYMTVRPQGNRAFLISDTTRRLKAADIWAKLDVLWMLAVHDAQAGRLNWKAPASFACTEVNSPTFTANQGYAGNGTTSYIDTNWNPAVNGVNYTRDNALFSIYSRTAAQHAGSDAGWVGSVGTTIETRNGSNNATYRVNQSALDTIAVATGDGLYSPHRTGASATELFKNGASLTTGSQASTAIESNNFFIGRVSSVGYSTIQIASASAGASLTAAQHAALFAIELAYMRAVGAST
jgi:hypothetical protein